MRKLSIPVLLFLLAAAPAAAQQLDIPRVSPSASVTQRIGTTDITVEYHRPGVKSRTIWGGLVPFDRTWRMGANEATTISFSDAVRIEGTEVPAGKYSFFSIPGRDRWTLILNKDPEQFGAFGYDQSKDQLRVTVTPNATGQNVEWMRFVIEPTDADSAVVAMEWEKLRVPMKVDVDVSKLVWRDVDQALASTSAQAANWALESGTRLDEGLGWIDQSIARGGENIFNLWTRARLLHRLGRSKEAMPVIDRALTMARGQQGIPQEFISILEGTRKSIQADTAR